jgi:large subunit ribosomal protein L15
VKLNKLVAPKGSRRPLRRVGRGTGSGMGKTSGKGTKGQLARSGPGLPGWFEGGQTPLHMRIPKLRGFKNRFRVEFVAVNVDVLEGAAVDGKVSVETLAAKGLVRQGSRIKVLADGELSKPLQVHAHAASATAKKKIEAAGGSLVIVAMEKA